MAFFADAEHEGGVSQHALMVRFDSAATGSGTMDQQNPAQLILSAFKGNYVFGLRGFDPTNKALQMVGKFQADGLGNLPVNFAEQDINDDGTENTLSAVDATLHGTFFLDPLNPGTGRGTLQLINTSTAFPGTFNFTFYMVDGTHIELVENDINALLAGSCFSAPNTNGSFQTSLLAGTYAFTQGGTTAGGQSLAIGSIFGANGTGSVLGGVMDRNTGGSTALDQAVTASSYTVDPNFGRIDLLLTVGGTTYNYAAYGTSSGFFEIIELDTSSSLSGEMFPQSSTGPLSGAYALNLAGVTSGSKSFAGLNAIGEIQANSSLEALSGSLDINSAGALSAAVPLRNCQRHQCRGSQRARYGKFRDQRRYPGSRLLRRESHHRPAAGHGWLARNGRNPTESILGVAGDYQPAVPQDTA